MTKCNHQFIKLREITKPWHIDGKAIIPGKVLRTNDMHGASVACAVCGEVRHIWEDGNITIIMKVNESEPNTNKIA